MKKRIFAMALVAICLVSAMRFQEVKAEQNGGDTEYAIYVEENDGGVVTVDCEKAKAGQEITFSVVENGGYNLQAVYLDDKALEGNSFIMPARGVVLTPIFAKEGTAYSIQTEASRYGRIMVTETSACAGDKVVLDYYALNGYVLDAVMLNGEVTELDEQNSFTMPSEDVVVSASFQKAMEDTEIVIKVPNANSDGVSYWYFSYTPDAFCITVKVKDATIIGTGEAKSQDYVECMFNVYQQDVSSWQYGKTVKYTVTAGGEAYVQKALGALEFSRISAVEEGFSYQVTEKQIMDQDGYSGYEVQMSIPYELLGTTYEEAQGNLLVCPAQRNSESLVTTKWMSAYTWFDVSTHHRVTVE